MTQNLNIMNDKVSNFSDFVSINADIIPKSKAMISVADRGLRFGDGIFETIRINSGIPYQWEQHLKRLNQGLEALKIDYNTNSLLKDSLALIRKNAVNDGVLRIMITRGEGSVGYLPTNNCVSNVIIEAIGKKFPPIAPANLFLSSYTKISPSSLPPFIKHMQGLNSILAKIEASENGCEESLLLDDKGHICESSSGNIFWVKGNILHTAASDCPMVAGTMREKIIEFSPLKLEQGYYRIDELYNADEVFLSNSSWPIMPIARLKPAEISYSSHKVAEALLAIIEKDMQAYANAWQPPMA